MSRNSREALGCVLVPTDFSGGSRRALERAALLPLREGGRIDVLHVLPRRSTGGRAAESDAQALLEKAAAQIRARTGVRGGGRAPTVTTTFLSGGPHVEIIRHSRALEAELIVIGRGGGSRPRRLPGTTAARVVRMGDVPTLLVVKPAKRAYRRTLVATNLGESTRRILRLARKLRAADAGPIHLLHAYHVPFQGFVPAGPEERPTLHHQQIREEAQARLSRLCRSLEAGGYRIEPVLRHGDPRSTILSEAARLRADLIALGTHGRSGLAHVLVGSVAESVISTASHDVLVARPVRFTFEMP